jgi:hypothetical protein
MLKITISKDTHRTVFKLEGRLIQPWVRELEECWRQTLNGAVGDGFAIDLQSVTYASPEGKELLRSMHRSGAELIAAGTQMKSIVEQITGKSGQER